MKMIILETICKKRKHTDHERIHSPQAKTTNRKPVNEDEVFAICALDSDGSGLCTGVFVIAGLREVRWRLTVGVGVGVLGAMSTLTVTEGDPEMVALALAVRGTVAETDIEELGVEDGIHSVGVSTMVPV